MIPPILRGVKRHSCRFLVTHSGDGADSRTIGSRIAALGSTPIRVHPVNPYIFEFRGKPTVLRTFGPHYGWLFNSSLSALPHMDVMQRDGMNLTRIWAMGYPSGVAQDLIQTWSRSTTGTSSLWRVSLITTR